MSAWLNPNAGVQGPSIGQVVVLSGGLWPEAHPGSLALLVLQKSLLEHVSLHVRG